MRSAIRFFWSSLVPPAVAPNKLGDRRLVVRQVEIHQPLAIADALTGSLPSTDAM